MNLPQIIHEALNEDLGTGDVTTAATVPDGTQATATIIAKSDGVLCGVEVASAVFHAVDTALEVRANKTDGTHVEVGDICMTISGSAGSMLKAERVALNFLQRLSGIATRTQQFASKLQHAKVYDTRKTTPLLRELERYAVHIGGGENHRNGLYDAILIKENHIAIAGSVTKAIQNARTQSPDLSLEVEVQNLDELEEALAAMPDIIMLDNFAPKSVEQAVAIVETMDQRPQLEVSGGITLETITQFDLPGIDRISVGAVTHSVPVLDLSLLLA